MPDPSPIIQQLLCTVISNSDETYKKCFFIQYPKHNETSGCYCAKRYIERMMKQRVILFVANIGWFITAALQLNVCRPTKPFHRFALVHSFHKNLIFLIWSYLCFLFESHCQCHFVKEFKSKKSFQANFPMISNNIAYFPQFYIFYLTAFIIIMVLNWLTS